MVIILHPNLLLIQSSNFSHEALELFALVTKPLLSVHFFSSLPPWVNSRVKWLKVGEVGSSKERFWRKL